MKAVPERLKRENQIAGGWVFRLALTLGVFLAVAVTSHAQLPEPPIPVDPRPLTQLISDSEKALLTQSDNPKKLVEAYLKISETHLQAAFDLIRVNNHGAAERELDVYNKAVAAAGKQAFELQDGKRSLSKRIEQVLYRQIKMLENIERMFPSEREVFAEAALRNTKRLRVQALNAAFDSGGVLKDPDDENKPKNEPLVKDGQPVIREESAIAPHSLSRPPSVHELGRVARLLIWPALPLSQPTGVSGRAGAIGVNSLSRTPAFRGVAPSSLSVLLVNLACIENAAELPQLPGDYLTDEEDEHVREAQVADARAKVFMKIADRRLKAIIGPAALPVEKKDQKKVEEEEREWGVVPKVTRTELLRHYARAISECMAKLEDAYEHNPKSTALPKALSVLRDATDRHLQMLRALKAEMTSDAEVAALSGAIYEAETANKGARDGLK